MLTIRVKFINGLEKSFENVNHDMAIMGKEVLTIAINQKIDEHGKFVSGVAYRIPLTSILFLESIDTEEGITVEGKVKE